MIIISMVGLKSMSIEAETLDLNLKYFGFSEALILCKKKLEKKKMNSNLIL